LDVYTGILNKELGLCVSVDRAFKPAGLLRYWRLFKKFDPHVIMFVNGCLGLFPWYAYLDARLSGAPRVLAIEQLIADPAPPKVEEHGLINLIRRCAGWQARYLFTFRIQAMLTHRTICVSDAVRERLIREYSYSADKTLTIRNAVDLKQYGITRNGSQELRRELKISPHDHVAVCVARLNRNKRIDILLKAMSLVSRQYSSCKCVIVGDGACREELVKQSEELGLSSAVFFVGHQEDVRPYLQMADLFVLSSDKEGLPLALLEAMACGLPCVVTRVAGNSEAVLNGYNGLLVSPGSAEELAAAVVSLLCNRDERHRMARNARQKVQEFDADTLLAQLKAVLLN